MPINISSSWAYTDMAFHSLELSRDADTTQLSSTHEAKLTHPGWFTSTAPISIFHIRPWQHLALNEGSFLKAYEAYEYFDRLPPSIMPQLFLDPFDSAHALAHRDDAALPALKSFSYTAIFPFEGHLRCLRELGKSGVKNVSLQLAPEPESGILDSKERRGRVQLDDCWRELLTGYFRQIENAKYFEHIERFEARDYAIEPLREDLDRIGERFQTVDGWSERGGGIWTRRKVVDAPVADPL